MDAEQQNVARACHQFAENNSMSFPLIVAKLVDAGFESYTVDFRRGTTVYYLPSGDNIELPLSSHKEGVAASFQTADLQAAIREAQEGLPSYTYLGFCQKVKAAGCAGYIVSFLGSRANYFGRTGETYVEAFPQ